MIASCLSRRYITCAIETASLSKVRLSEHETVTSWCFQRRIYEFRLFLLSFLDFTATWCSEPTEAAPDSWTSGYLQAYDLRLTDNTKRVIFLIFSTYPTFHSRSRKFNYTVIKNGTWKNRDLFPTSLFLSRFLTGFFYKTASLRLGAFRKSLKSPISSVKSVRSSVCLSVASSKLRDRFQ